MSVVEELRQNNPATTEIRINLHDEPSDADLAQALQQNPFITDITLDLSVQRAAWDSLLRAIATRVKLETVELWDAFDPEERNAPAAVRAILRAIQQNSSIRSVSLTRLCLPVDIATFVENASSIESFTLQHCDMEAVEQQQGTRELAAALQRNTNIKTLALWMLDDIDHVAILERLSTNAFLKSLEFFSRNQSDAAYRAIQQLLESSTCSIQQLRLRGLNGETLGPIAQAITNSQSVSELKFTDICFPTEESHANFQSMLQNKRNLTSLCLDHCSFYSRQVQVQESIMSALTRPASQLRCFEWSSFHLTLDFPNNHLETFLRAIQKSKLERFLIGCIESQQEWQTLVRSIPSWNLKELEVRFILDDEYQEPVLDIEVVKQDLLHAIKNNFSLRLVKGYIVDDGSDLFAAAEDKQRLAFFAIRNESLEQWVDNPKKVNQKVWPEALALAEKAGPDSLFRGVRSVLGSDSTSLSVGRKRKRPLYYTP